VVVRSLRGHVAVPSRGGGHGADAGSARGPSRRQASASGAGPWS
jgi:hypothetical protein